MYIDNFEITKYIVTKFEGSYIDMEMSATTFSTNPDITFIESL